MSNAEMSHVKLNVEVWTKTPPDVPDMYHHWSGHPRGKPVIRDVLFFAGDRQRLQTHHAGAWVDVASLGGWWSRITVPPLPVVKSERERQAEEYRGWQHGVLADAAAVMADKGRQLEAEIASLKAERDKLAAFKAWVHDWLDKAGVPSDPDPQINKATGCRIHGRMRWLQDFGDHVSYSRSKSQQDEIARLRAAVSPERLERIAGEIAENFIGSYSTGFVRDIIAAKLLEEFQ